MTGFEGTHGTVNEKYLIDNDSLIIDTELLFDYKLLVAEETVIYNSQKRYDILKKPNMDSLIVVTRQQFDSIIKTCISLLTACRYPIEIDEENQIPIIRAINTITYNQDNSFKSGVYAEFMKLVKDKNYEKEMTTNHYYDWIPSRGMGFYFQKLQIELGGTPHSYSLYTIE